MTKKFLLLLCLTTAFSNYLLSQVATPVTFKYGDNVSNLDECSNYQLSAVHKDAFGDFYNAGNFESNIIDIDPSIGQVNLINTGARDGFVAKYDDNATLQWGFSLGFTGNDGVTGLKTDALANVYITGYFNETVDFDPGPGIYNLTASPLPGTTTGDVFVAKYDANGNFVWAFAYGSISGQDFGWALDVTPDGTVYVGGKLNITTNVDVDPGPGVFNLVPANGTAFCAKYDTDGNLIRAFNIGAPTQNSCVRNITLDTDGTLYLCGYIKGNCDIDPGPGVTLINSNSEDPFLIKVDTNFNFIWGFNIRTDNLADEGWMASIDATSVYFSGFVQGTGINLAPLGTGTSFTSKGGNDNFIAKYAKNGLYQWGHVIGGPGDDRSFGNSNFGNNLYMCGHFSDSVDFNPVPDCTFMPYSKGKTDGYVAKYDLDGNFQCAIQIGSFDDDHVHSVLEYTKDSVLINGTFHATALIPNFIVGGFGYPIISAGGLDGFVSKMYWNGCNVPCMNSMNYDVLDSIIDCSTAEFNAVNFGRSEGINFQWNFGDGQTGIGNPVIHRFSTSGTYNVTLVVKSDKDCGSCGDTVVHQIFIDIVTANFTVSDDTICEAQSINFTNASSANSVFFEWNFGDGTPLDNNQSPPHLFVDPGVYVVTLRASNSLLCFDNFSKTIIVDTITSTDFFASQVDLCEGQGIVFEAEIPTLTATGIEWQFGDGHIEIDKNPVEHAYDRSGIYGVTSITHFRRCADDTVTHPINVRPFPALDLGKDTSMCPNGPAIVLFDYINSSNPNAKWKWNTGDSTSSLQVRHPGIYTASVNVDGCITHDSVEVFKACYLDIPNAFSPNADGSNDYFVPRQLISKGVVEFKMVIFNRWGQMVFETRNIDGRGWDGKFNDNEQPSGVYIYVIDVSLRNGVVEHYEGNVSLLR